MKTAAVLALIVLTLASIRPLRADGIFTYEGGVLTTIDLPGSSGISTCCDLGVNNLGDIVGSYSANGSHPGFLYSKGSFTSISFPGASVTDPDAINDLGQIVGWDSRSGSFEYSNGTYTALPVEYATGINNSGEIVGYEDTVNGPIDFLFANGVWSQLSPVLYDQIAIGINNKGDILASDGILMPGGSFTYLNLGSVCFGVFLSGINDAGTVVGGDGCNAYLYQNGSVTTLHLPTMISGESRLVPSTLGLVINDSGEIVGKFQAVSLVPEPSLMLPVAGLLAVLGSHRLFAGRRQRKYPAMPTGNKAA